MQQLRRKLDADDLKSPKIKMKKNGDIIKGMPMSSVRGNQSVYRNRAMRWCALTARRICAMRKINNPM